MCAPEISFGLLGGRSSGSSSSGNSAAEAAKARAEAANKANAALAADQMRRRKQANLLAGGAADETLGGPTGLAGGRTGGLPNLLGAGAVRYDSVTGKSAAGAGGGSGALGSYALQSKRGVSL